MSDVAFWVVIAAAALTALIVAAQAGYSAGYSAGAAYVLKCMKEHYGQGKSDV